MRKDYLYHLIAGFLISAVSALLIRFLWEREWMIISWLIAVFIGLCKELIWDKWMKRGTPEFADLWFDAWGAGMATTLAYIIL